MHPVGQYGQYLSASSCLLSTGFGYVVDKGLTVRVWGGSRFVDDFTVLQGVNKGARMHDLLGSKSSVLFLNVAI